MKKLLGILLFISIALSANAQLLWKVSGKGLEKPSYIFGTYHLSPLSIKDSIAAMPQAMNETTQVYGEVVMSEMATPAFMQSMQQQMMMPKDTTLQNLFTPEQYEEVGKVVKENMMVDIAMLAQLKPAAINQQLVVLLYMKHTPGFNPQEQLDGNSCDPLPGEMEAMLDNRNKAWVEKMPAIMTEAPTLFVVGAGHLPGDNGVLNLLKQQGYTIEAMK